jgi:hypothetical protein
MLALYLNSIRLRYSHFCVSVRCRHLSQNIKYDVNWRSRRVCYNTINDLAEEQTCLSPLKKTLVIF